MAAACGRRILSLSPALALRSDLGNISDRFDSLSPGPKSRSARDKRILHIHVRSAVMSEAIPAISRVFPPFVLLLAAWDPQTYPAPLIGCLPRPTSSPETHESQHPSPDNIHDMV